MNEIAPRISIGKICAIENKAGINNLAAIRIGSHEFSVNIVGAIRRRTSGGNFQTIIPYKRIIATTAMPHPVGREYTANFIGAGQTNFTIGINKFFLPNNACLKRSSCQNYYDERR